jgi:dTDP-4-dehydrorhamnose 3,5-epimerase
VLDVFVDLRKASETYGQWDSIELSAENGRLVYIPKGFAHGFCTLTDNVVVLYKVDEYYAPEFEGGVRWDDPDLGIRWPVLEPILSARDAALPTFYRFQSPF